MSDILVTTAAAEGEGSLSWAISQAMENGGGSVMISADLAGETLTLRDEDSADEFEDISLVVPDGVTLQLDAYLTLYDGAQLVMLPGSSLVGTAADSYVQVVTGGYFAASGCTVDVMLDMSNCYGVEEWHLEDVTFTSACPMRIPLEASMQPEAWTYTCTHPNAYAEFGDLYVAVGESFTITEEYLASLLPEGCNFVHFLWPFVEGELVVEDGITWYVEDMQVDSDTAVLRCGKGVTLKPDPASAYGEGSTYCISLWYGTLIADDLTLEGTLFIGAGAVVQGSGIHLNAEHAACLELVDWDSSQPLNFLPGVSYDVGHADAVLSLDVAGIAQSQVWTQQLLNAAKPSAFASVAISGVSLSGEEPGEDGKPLSFVLDGVRILEDSWLYADDSVWMEIRNTALGDGTMLEITNGRLENADLSGSLLQMYACQDVTLDSCYGNAEFYIGCGGSFVARNCDFSSVTWLPEDWMEGEGAVIDLSGNYWGTTDVEEILARFGAYAEYVRIDSVLSEWSAPEDPTEDSLTELAPSLSDDPGVYSVTVSSRVAAGATRLYKLSPSADGSWSIGVDADSLTAPLQLSVGTVDAAGQFSALQSLLLAADASTSSLRGVCATADSELYVRVQVPEGTSPFSLNISSTQPEGTVLATHNNSAALATLSAADGSVADSWVGSGDACDFYRVEMESAGSLHIALAQLDNAARVRIYEQRGDGSLAQLDSRTVRAAAGLDHTLALTAGSYLVEISSLDNGSGLFNTAYSLVLDKNEESSPLTSPIGIA